MWVTALDQCELKSNGVYLSTEIYDDNEFETIITKLATLTGSSIESLQRDFGQYFFPQLMSIALKHIEKITNLFEFLIAVDNVIHIEVKKADHLAYTPTLFYDQPKSNVLIMRYVSKRKMCYFAEGLILGAAQHFNQSVSISQTQCLCKGDDHCLIRLET